MEASVSQSKFEHSPVPGTASSVDREDVVAVNKRERRSNYAKRARIYPKLTHGTFRRLKWLVMLITLGVYYLAPWIRWDRGLNAPDQAILVDMPGRRFYFFAIEIWPQEVYYITGLLIVAAVGLFLVTSLLGRVWCGYACPQTVWTDLFIAVERLAEGDRNARIRLDRAPWRAAKIFRKLAKHLIWIVIAVCTGGAWVFYFADAPTLLADLMRFDAPSVAYIFIGALTLTTYMLGGHAREQVCTYMCPWPRIQGAMVDADTVTVTYRAYRGEPRGSHKAGDGWEGRGHCVDCNQCVAVCPMGIDIRDGPQLECISCALCIDACNQVMTRIDLPRGLIGYDTDGNAARENPDLGGIRFFRPRTIAYTTVIAIVGSIMLAALVTRSDIDLNLLRDRNPLYVQLSDGGIRNAYTLKILNKQHVDRSFHLSFKGLEQATVTAVGIDGGEVPILTVRPDSLGSFRILATAPRAAVRSESTEVSFILEDVASGRNISHDSVFVGPAK